MFTGYKSLLGLLGISPFGTLRLQSLMMKNFTLRPLQNQKKSKLQKTKRVKHHLHPPRKREKLRRKR
jgi:hypothetical protein